jgi:anti-sigma regulatory factor (Ser/Thr protein kinase)
MISIAVNDASQVAEARRKASEIAQHNGFGEGDAGRVALVTTELATNLIKHGRGGELLVGPYADDDGGGVELLALDRGPGMADVGACLKDGYSTAGTRGGGLGAVFRQSNLVDIASWPGTGTAVLARIEPGKPAGTVTRPRASSGAVSIAMQGEEVCGDAWTVAHDATTDTFMVADGLGHGQDAAESAVEAVRIFHRFSGHRVPTLLDYIHGGLRSTRGAAVSIARFEPAERKVVFAGIGNVAGVLIANGEIKRMVSLPGTAGYNVRKIQAFEYPFESGLLILHSDGLTTSWTISRYPSLVGSHPTLIAGVLYRDFARHRDDATVLVAKWPAIS